ncbi:Thioredoxin superfamily protein [Rhynchospora pubera]|uniref:Thioredoxin superfamily protein n=1 Tax=Rhynchospora pubera TaxID=906938 RepID=A0AAV8APD0_9POAL|nr:Thioredoxin superfamily protein [Rhynchospora pubera]
MAKSLLIPKILLLLLFSSQLDPSKASSVPSKLDGFAYNGSGPWKDSVLIEAFFDPVCPDSRDSWPPLKKVVEQFAPRVSLIVHPFPLPFHNNAYLACRALHIANKLNSSSTYDLLELFFKYQEKYYNGPTASASRIAIQKDMSKLGAFALGNSFLADLKMDFKILQLTLLPASPIGMGAHEAFMGAPFSLLMGSYCLVLGHL